MPERTATAPLPGAVDCLREGFEALIRRPWLLSIPLLLDLFLWRGPFLSALPAAEPVLDAFFGPAATGGLPPEGAQALENLRQGSLAFLVDFNLFSLLALSFAASVPSANAAVGHAGGVVLSVEPGSLAPLLAGLQLAGLALATWYYSLLAQQVAGYRMDIAESLRRAPRRLITLLLYMLLLIMALLAASVPFSLFAAFGMVIGMGGALFSLAILVFNVALIWAIIFLYFVVDAVVIRDHGVRRAILSSAMVVRIQPRSAVFFMLLSFIISAGTQVIWGELSANSAGALAAIVANAYVGSSLAAASMFFYLSRVSRLERI